MGNREMKNKKRRRTIQRDELARLSFINSPRLPRIVNDNSILKEWVGIGWINLDEKPHGNTIKVID